MRTSASDESDSALSRGKLIAMNHRGLLSKAADHEDTAPGVFTVNAPRSIR